MRMIDNLDDMKVVIVGHKNYGKSTIIRQLVTNTWVLPEAKLEEQGTSAEVDRCIFKSEKRHYIIKDATEESEIFKNMVTGPLQVDAALLVMNAEEGLQLHSLRNIYLLSMLGVKAIVVLVNKMDLVNYSQKVYEAIAREVVEFAIKVGLSSLVTIPMSGRFGDNLVVSSACMPWYQGMTLLEALNILSKDPLPVDKPFRMPVQGVNIQRGDPRRIIAGTVVSGTLQFGDEVVFYPSGKKARLDSMEDLSGRKLTKVQAGYPIRFTLEEPIYVSRGELVAKGTKAKPKVSNRLRVNLLWLGQNSMNEEKTYLLKLGTTKVRVKLEEIRRLMDVAGLDWREGGERIESHQVAECILRCDKLLAFDLWEDNLVTGRFMIVDDYEHTGYGIVLEGLDERNIQWHSTTVDRTVREQLNGHPGGVLWFTGLSGSGKSTLANALEKRLSTLGIRTYLLDGDNVRYGLNQDLGFSKLDRSENIRRIAEVAKLFTDAGMFVLTAFISPYEADRQLAREIIGTEDFLEIYVACSLEECERRDPKGVYAKARRGEIPHFTGISQPYEVPLKPDISVCTEKECVEAEVERVLAELVARNLI